MQHKAILISHYSHPDCVGDNGFTDVQFRDAFCAGLIGERDNSLDLQCQRVTGWPESEACNVSLKLEFGISIRRRAHCLVLRFLNTDIHFY